jgi:hypothetical protein
METDKGLGGPLTNLQTRCLRIAWRCVLDTIAENIKVFTVFNSCHKYIIAFVRFVYVLFSLFSFSFCDLLFRGVLE